MSEHTTHATRIARRLTTALALAGLAASLGAAGASAAIVGQALAPDDPNVSACNTTATYAQTGVLTGNSYTVPADGSLTSYSTRAFKPDGAATLRFAVFRGPATSKTVVGIGSATLQLTSVVPAAPITTAIAPISVKAGDVIGMEIKTTSGGFPSCAIFSNAPEDSYDAFLGVLPAVGQSLLMQSLGGFRFSIAANLQVGTTLVATDTTGEAYLLRARLRTANPVSNLSGETIRFTAGGTLLCTATTNANGVATCSPSPENKLALGAIRNARSYTASFAGTTGFGAASDAAAAQPGGSKFG